MENLIFCAVFQGVEKGCIGNLNGLSNKQQVKSNEQFFKK